MSVNYQDSDGNILVNNDGDVIVRATSTPLITDTVVMTSAEVKALRANGKTLIAAPGANKIAIVDSLVLKLNYGGTNAFTESADNLVLEYYDSGTDITGSIETTGFIDGTADYVAVIRPASIATMAAATVGVNEAVRLFNTGDGEIAGNAANDNTLTAVITYHVVDFN